MNKDKWIAFFCYFLIYAVLMTIVCLGLDAILSQLSSWYFYVFQGLFFGIAMACLEMWVFKRKKKKD